MEIIHTFLLPAAWLALITLTLLEIVLGIDNLVFLSIMTSKLPESQQPHARVTGLLLAMLARIGLLFAISLLMRLTQPLFSFHTSWLNGNVTGQSIIVFAGGLFLLYKSVAEVHDKLEGIAHTEGTMGKKVTFWHIIIQIVLLDIIFSFDSVLTAIGMVSFKEFGYGGGMAIMVIAIVLSVLLMLLFSGPISRFANTHPTIQMLALSFLMLIGVMLILEAAHLAEISLWGKTVQEIPKGYIYFAIGFSLLVEVLNMKLSKKKHRETI
ncbi:MAG: TerC family protein [Tannerellaceae bacterium]|nr:TerC family protein [Tannerellaceae bacterium]